MVVVVVVEVSFQVLSEACVLGDKIAGKGGFPALFEDASLDPFPAPVCLRSAGVDRELTGCSRTGPPGM